MMQDLGWPVESKRVLTDADACRGRTSRRGVGKTRHIELRRLWLQEAVESRGLTLGRIDGLKNPSKPMTKLISYPAAMRAFRSLSVI